MPQIQRSTEAGEQAQVFIQFVMMQHQQALIAMGRHPSVGPGGPPPNLGLAEMFIRQLGVIRMKTEGNLSASELEVLESALDQLEQTYEEVTSGLA